MDPFDDMNAGTLRIFGFGSLRLDTKSATQYHGQSMTVAFVDGRAIAQHEEEND